MILNPRRVFCALLVVIVALTAASLVVQAIRITTGHDRLMGLKQLFDLNGERNIASWFSSLNLLISAILLYSIGGERRRNGFRFAPHWLAMSVIFLLLAMDEAIGLHELLTKPLRHAVNLPSIFYYAWIIPGAIFSLAFFVAYLNFLRHLPAGTACLFLISGVLFIGGAVGVEAIEGYVDATYGHAGWGFVILTTLEEVGEMAGIALFIYALMDYIAANLPIVQIRFAARQAAAAGVLHPARLRASAGSARYVSR